MSSSTRTVPASHTRPRSLRSRSISMMCSARSFGCAASARHLAPIAAGPAAARPRAGDRARVDAPSRDAHQSLGRGAQDRDSAPLRERGERCGVGRAQPLVERRRRRCVRQRRAPSVELHLPGARQVGLVDVAGAHVLLGALRRARDRRRGSSSRHRRCAAARQRRCGAPAPPARRVRQRCARARLPRPASATAQHASSLQSCTSAQRRAQREGSQGSGVRGSSRCGSISCGELVAQEQRPAAGERQLPGLLGARRARDARSASHQFSSAARKPLAARR